MCDEQGACATREPSRAFDHRGHRIGGEIDLDNRRIGTKISDMTPEDWASAAEAVRRWRPGAQP